MSDLISKKKEKELIRLYPKMEDQDIAKILGVSEWVVRKKANDLGLVKEPDQGQISKEITDWLIDFYPSYRNDDISKMFSMSKSEIEHAAFRLGLRKNKDYFGTIQVTDEERILIKQWNDEYEFSSSANSRGNYVLGKILNYLFPMCSLYPEHPIGQLRIDWYVKERMIGFEFQGVQHEQFNAFHFETKYDFIKAQNRDFEKSYLCESVGISLVHIYHDENLSISLIKEKIADIT
ncbi:hypothetical protein D3C72_1189400 [compost metagenome]